MEFGTFGLNSFAYVLYFGGTWLCHCMRYQINCLLFVHPVVYLTCSHARLVCPRFLATHPAAERRGTDSRLSPQRILDSKTMPVGAPISTLRSACRGSPSVIADLGTGHSTMAYCLLAYRSFGRRCVAQLCVLKTQPLFMCEYRAYSFGRLDAAELS